MSANSPYHLSADKSGLSPDFRSALVQGSQMPKLQEGLHKFFKQPLRPH